MSSGSVDPERRAQVLALVASYLALRPGDLARFDCTFQQTDPDSFTVRLDYAPARKGGYQILTGTCSENGQGYVVSSSPVLGRGKVTPRHPLVQPSGPSFEEREAERRQLDMDLEFRRDVLNNEREA